MADHLARAIEIAVESASADGGPFGAVVEVDGRVFEGRNAVSSTNDPSAHAEIQAVRAACASVGRPDLPGAVVYASGQPCPMCFAALHWAGVARVVYAAGWEKAARAGFDDRWIADIACGSATGPIDFVHEPRHNDNAPFEAWAANPERREY